MTHHQKQWTPEEKNIFKVLKEKQFTLEFYVQQNFSKMRMKSRHFQINAEINCHQYICTSKTMKRNSQAKEKLKPHRNPKLESKDEHWEW